MVSVDELNDINHEMWSGGDYPEIAKLLAAGAAALVDRLPIGTGTSVLDLATGNGNVALLAAARGAEVIGLDLTDAHFDHARRRADAAGVRVEFVVGNAEDLTRFPDDGFDVVTSTFGVQFAPRHERVATELARLCRPGGSIGMCNWTPTGWTGRFQDIIALYFPEPPAYVRPPMLWGREDYVRDLLGADFELVLERRKLRYDFDGPEAAIAYFEDNFGPCLIAKRSISPRSRWAELRAELVTMTTEHFRADHGRLEPEFLMVVGCRRGRTS